MSKQIRVAFDVKGTLEGPDKVLKLYKWFKSAGCHMTVWSSIYEYAAVCERELGLCADEVTSKIDRVYNGNVLEDNPDYNWDIAVDDRDFTENNGTLVPFLACNVMIPVHDIPEDEREFDNKFGYLLGADHE